MKRSRTKQSWIREVKFDSQGLIPAIVEDAKTHQVLMMAWMNRQALMKTLKTKKTHFYSRSRRRMWLKGESSGHIQNVKGITLDCDGDALLVSVSQTGGACHAGYRSCFYRKLKSGRTWKVNSVRIFDPEAVYSTSLRGAKRRSNLTLKTRLPRAASRPSQ